MTEPSPLTRLAEVPLGKGRAALTWLGQAGFALRSPGGTTALIDPFLAPHEGRLYDTPLLPAQAAGVDVVLCTHEHIDHFDAESAPAIAAASPAAVFVVPFPIVDMATEAGIAADRVIGVQPGEMTEVAGLTIHTVPACHGVTMEDAYGFGHELSGGLYRFVGFVVEVDGLRVYHAGDTIHFEGMEEGLPDVDVALLPINGRDAEREARGIVGNLDHREAAWLASRIGADLLIPMHYDLFARNRGYPSQLLEAIDREYPDVPVYVPPRAHPFVCTGRKPR